jgi:hypothetical protein
LAQYTALPLQQCLQNATQADVSSVLSTNYQQGIVPSCTVTVYLTGTSTLATVYSTAAGGTLSNPFTASSAGQFLAYASASNQYDVVLNGGVVPNTYPSPVTFVGLAVGEYPPCADIRAFGATAVASCSVTGTYSDTAINSALGSASCVHIPAGYFVIQNPLVLPAYSAGGILIEGEGEGRSVICNQASGDAIQSSNTHLLDVRDIGITDAYSGVRSGGDGIHLSNTGSSVEGSIEHVQIGGHTNGVALTNGIKFNIQDVRSTGFHQHGFAVSSSTSTILDHDYGNAPPVPSTTLSSSIANTSTCAFSVSLGNVPAGTVLYVDTEYILISSGTNGAYGCTRGYDSSTAATHSNWAAVLVLPSLSSSIANTSTCAFSVSLGNVPAGSVLYVDSEYILISSGTNGAYSCTRGYNYTTAATHANTAPVTEKSGSAVYITGSSGTAVSNGAYEASGGCGIEINDAGGSVNGIAISAPDVEVNVRGVCVNGAGTVAGPSGNIYIHGIHFSGQYLTASLLDGLYAQGVEGLFLDGFDSGNGQYGINLGPGVFGAVNEGMAFDYPGGGGNTGGDINDPNSSLAMSVNADTGVVKFNQQIAGSVTGSATTATNLSGGTVAAVGPTHSFNSPSSLSFNMNCVSGNLEQSWEANGSITWQWYTPCTSAGALNLYSVGTSNSVLSFDYPTGNATFFNNLRTNGSLIGPGGVTWIPSTVAGYQGTSGTRVQLGRGSPAAGNLANFASDGSIEDSGVPTPTLGYATLSSGTVTVSTGAACSPGSSCIYKLTNCGTNSSTALGVQLTIGTVSSGTSFVINSESATNALVTGDSSHVCWEIN